MSKTTGKRSKDVRCPHALTKLSSNQLTKPLTKSQNSKPLINLTFNNKAISPLIATVLLIGITLASFALIVVWTRGFISERIEKFGENMDVVCGRIDYSAYVAPIEGGSDPSIVTLVIDNKGNDNINSINVKLVKGGKSVVRTLMQKAGAPITGKKPGEINVDIDDFFPGEYLTLDDINEIEITPVLKGIGESSKKAKAFVCDSLTRALSLK